LATSPATARLLLRDVNTGAFEVYDIASNQLTRAASLGQVGQEWGVGGFAPDPLTILPRQRVYNPELEAPLSVDATDGANGGSRC
jgi:hypothetical protein